MKNNVYKKYQNLRLIHKILSMPLSLTALYVVYICISLYGYKHYGLAIFEQRWAIRPTFWQEVKTFLQLAVVWKGLALWTAAVVTDSIAWPYFYKLKAAKIESGLEHGATSEARTTARPSEMGSDRTSGV